MQLDLFLLSFVGVATLVVNGLLLRWGLGRLLSHTKHLVVDETERSFKSLLIFMPAKHFYIAVAVTAIAIALLVLIFTQQLAWAFVSGALFLACLPLVRTWLVNRRLALIHQQLPDGMRLLVGGLQAGLSLLPALTISAEQLPRPLASEFYVLIQRQRAGDSLAQALALFYHRAPSQFVEFFVFALITSHRHGGQQGAMLARMADALQQQHYARERMLSLSAQARLQGKIMMLLPVLLFFAINAVQPSSTDLLLYTQAGQLLLLVAFTMLALGFFITRRILGSFNHDFR